MTLILTIIGCNLEKMPILLPSKQNSSYSPKYSQPAPLHQHRTHFEVSIHLVQRRQGCGTIEFDDHAKPSTDKTRDPTRSGVSTLVQVDRITRVKATVLACWWRFTNTSRAISHRTGCGAILTNTKSHHHATHKSPLEEAC